MKAELPQYHCYERSTAQESEDAISACNRFVTGHPSDANAYLDRGLAFLNGKRFDQAEADFARAHDLDPHSPWPLANRGITYAWKNDSARAQRDFETVRAADPTNAVLFRGEALLKMQRGDLDGEIDDLSAQLSRDPTDLWSLRMRADAYQQRGDFEKARADRAKF